MTYSFVFRTYSYSSRWVFSVVRDSTFSVEDAISPTPKPSSSPHLRNLHKLRTRHDLKNPPHNRINDLKNIKNTHIYLYVYKWCPMAPPIALFKRFRDFNRALAHVVRVIYDLFLFNLIGKTLEPYIEDNNFKLGYRKNVLIASFYLSYYEIQNGGVTR